MSDDKKEPTLMEKINIKEKELMDNLSSYAELKKTGYKLFKKMALYTDSDKLVELKKQLADNKIEKSESKKKRLKIFDTLLPMQHTWYKDVINKQQELLKEKDAKIVELEKKQDEVLDFTDKGIKRPSNV